ncbi:reverse transcriptase domain-containing protein [Tanacetum coccineum]|uniref:Reverse transcriptase domain-containing protein n=1 Tax=Tanacetum coccineum TaxID=301880 RepID=A0ABQ5JAD1_9ASTR
MGSRRTKEDDLSKISTSIFVTNFPEKFSAKDLFITCKQYGHVVDTYIPLKRSKAGKEVGFVRFINVFSVERLVNNLCTIWIDKYKLQANTTRFQRPSLNSKASVPTSVGGGRVIGHMIWILMHLVLGMIGDVHKICPIVLTRQIKYVGEKWIMLEFDDTKAMNLFRNNVSVASWFSQFIQASTDFVLESRIAWVEIEGIPLKLWSDNTFKRIAAKWGVMLDIDDQDDDSKETPGWVPDFANEEDNEDISDVDSKDGALKVDETRNSGFNQPIKQVLNKADTSGRLAPYSVELAAYNITYEPRSAIKGQVLADFINEIPVGSDAVMPRQTQYTVDHDKDCKEEWVLYTDGASSAKGSGAGLVLISPTKTEYTYALRLNFESTNNQAEYEALLAGLRIAKKMGVQFLSVNVDSKLVASQINGNYEACKESMIRYLSRAKEYISCFKIFKIQNIPRNKNQKADVLSKLASVAFNHLTKEVLVETLDVPSTDMKEINAVVEEEGETWMTPIINCLERGIWPEDQHEAHAL